MCIRDREKALELKSVSSHMMNALEATERPLKIHRLQAFHYTKDPKLTRGDIVYICRDDCRMMEFPILANDEKIEKEYRDYIETITGFYTRKEEPPKDKPILFDEDMCKITLNRQVGWSGYLTKVYGFESQMDFENQYKSMAGSWSRVLTRIKDGKEMTKNNLEKIEEMKKYGFNAKKLAIKSITTKENE